MVPLSHTGASAPHAGAGAPKVLRQLAAQVGEPPSQPVLAFCRRFRLQLNHFAEYGVDLTSGELALMTLGCGGAFGRELGRFVEELGVGVGVVDRITALQSELDSWMLARVAPGAEGRPDVGMYFRKAMAVTDVLGLLERHGVNAEERAALQHLAALLGSARTGIVAALLRPEGPPWFKVYLHAYDLPGAPLGETLSHVFGDFGIPDRDWRPLIEGLGPLKRGGVADAFVSLLLGDGDPFDSVKIDLFQVPFGPLEHTLRALKAMPEHMPSPAALGGGLGLDAAEHMGLRFDGQGCHASVYYVPRRVL